MAASILSADFGCMAEDAGSALERGSDWLHVDVMDGHFVPNLTMGTDMIAGVRRHLPEAFLDVHLMVTRPADYVKPFAEAGADLFTFHIETCLDHGGETDPHLLLAKIEEAGMRAGMVMNPQTPVETLEPYLDRLDLALVMSVNPGRSGQTFMPEVLPKATWLRQRLPADARVEMDGGIKPHNAEQVRDAGVDVIVAASAIFGADDRRAAIAALAG